MRALKRYLLGVAVVFLYSPFAQAVSIQWQDNKLTAVIDGSIQITKPNGDWDTQETKDPSAPVKWVLHRGGANPVIWLRYNDSPAGKNIAQFAGSVRNELVRRGLRIEKEQARSINGRKAYLFYAVDSALRGNASFLIGVYRNRSKGWILECNSVPVDFNQFESQFLSSIDSVKIF
jgi:hypothetical protein